MKFRITLQCTDKKRFLPIDYQYFISAWVYKVLLGADAAFARFLHEQGYGNDVKRFKLFCYSPLQFTLYKVWKEKHLFEIFDEVVTLQVSFMLPDAAERFIVGLFNRQKAFLGDHFNGLNLLVSHIERCPEVTIQPTMVYKSGSPIVFSKPGQERKPHYMHPDDDDYEVAVKNHLNAKLMAVKGLQPTSIQYMDDQLPIVFRVRTEPKSKLITVKPGTPQQSKVRGYLYGFELTADAWVHKLIINAGFGEKNATGFGWCEVV